MANGKLRRKVRRKLGIAMPTTPGSTQKSSFSPVQTQPIQRKGCCGRTI